MADLADDIRTLIQKGMRPVTFEEIVSRGREPRVPRRRTVARVVSVIVIGAVAIPVGLTVFSATSTTAPSATGTAKHRVLAALSATIASGSFDMAFSNQPLALPASAPPTTTCSPTSGGWSACQLAQGTQGLAVDGTGTIDTDPFAMVAVSQVPGLGLITLRANGTTVWEIGGGDYGLAPGSTDSGPGASLSGFAGSVEGTLGPRQGALDMMGLANPTGYLELDQNAITSADRIGTGTVDGVPVTIYQVSLHPSQETNVPGTSPEEASTIQSALAVLEQQGYTGTTIKVSIDSAGYIRQTASVASFSDGATQTSETSFSNFGCAGTVLMPGQAGSSSPPSGCVSPDTASTTTAPSTSTTQ